MNRLAIIVSIFSFQSIIFGQIYEFDAKTPVITEDVIQMHFLIDNVQGLAGCSNGEILRTSNEGETWTHILTIPTENGVAGSNDIPAIYAFNTSSAMLATWSGMVYYTDDLWQTWSLVHNGSNISYVYDDAFYGIDDRYMLARYGGDILFTEDFGTSWDSIQAPTVYGAVAIDVHSSGLGFIVGEGGTIAKTTDGGQTWLPVSGIPTTANFRDVSIIDANTAIVVGFGGAIIKTTNGGLTWTTLNSGTSQNLWGVDMYGNTGLVVGLGGTVLETDNGGSSWTSNTTHDYLATENVYAVHTMNAFKAGIAGSAGQIEMAPTTPFSIVVGDRVAPDSACVGQGFYYSFWVYNDGPQEAVDLYFNALCNSYDFFGGEIFYPGPIPVGDTVVVTIPAIYNGAPGSYGQVIYAKHGNPASIIAFTLGTSAMSFGTAQPYSLDGATNFCPGDTVTIEASGGSSYYWYINSSPDPYSPVQEVTPTQTQWYTVDIYQSNCVIKDSLVLTLDPGCIPDTTNTNPQPATNYAFSPNNDGVNDYLVLDFLDTMATDNYVAIFNRWGDLIFETENYNNVDAYWDGTYNSKPPLAGTYFFICETQSFGPLRGWIQVVK